VHTGEWPRPLSYAVYKEITMARTTASLLTAELSPAELQMRKRKEQSALLKDIVASGARIAIVLVDDNRHLKLKFRTWTKLKVPQLTENLKYNKHSKFVFVAKDCSELPTVLPFISIVAIKRNSKSKDLLLLRSNTAPTSIRHPLGQLERLMNEQAAANRLQRSSTVISRFIGELILIDELVGCGTAVFERWTNRGE